MRTVWKYVVDLALLDRVSCPGEVVLVAAPRPRAVAIWAEVDPAEPGEDREYIVLGTGHPIPDGAQHVGSTLDGPFVWHVYRADPGDDQFPDG